MEAGKTTVYVNARKEIDCPIVEANELECLFEAMQVYVSAVSTISESATPRATAESHGRVGGQIRGKAAIFRRSRPR